MSAEIDQLPHVKWKKNYQKLGKYLEKIMPSNYNTFRWAEMFFFFKLNDPYKIFLTVNPISTGFFTTKKN